jgi:LTXXQ motif family protein
MLSVDSGRKGSLTAVIRGPGVTVMSRANCRVTSLGIALLFTLTLVSGTEARPRWQSSHFARPSAVHFARPSAGSGGGEHATPSIKRTGPLGVLIDQLIRDCNREVVELRNFPAESIAQTIGPDETQDAALKNIVKIAADAADTLVQSCPKEPPVSPADQLFSLDREMEAVQLALDSLQPPLRTFYQSLEDEQKARLVVRYFVASGDAGRAAELLVAQARSTTSADGHQGSFPARKGWNCDQLRTELRAWPVARIEQATRLAPRQRAAFYDLAASLQRAADSLEDLCPRETALTPIGRIEDMRERLYAMRKSTAIIRPVLGRFHEVLDAGQRTRFAEMM